MTLTFNELKQAATTLASGDTFLSILAHPAFWVLALFSLAVLIGSRFMKVPTKTQNIFAVVVLVFVAIGATLALPVSGDWVAKNGDLAKKSAAYLGWKRTDAATFNRFEVLKMQRDMAHDVEVAQSVLDGVVKKGGVAKDAEPAVMAAMSMLHHTELSKVFEGPAKAAADAAKAAEKATATAEKSAAAVAGKPVAGAPVAEAPAKAASK